MIDWLTDWSQWAGVAIIILSYEGSKWLLGKVRKKDD